MPMAKLLLHDHSLLPPLFFFTLFLSFHSSEQQLLQSSQVLALLKIPPLLNYYPPLMTTWTDTSDFCNFDPNPSLTLVCYQGNLTQLHISGNTDSPPPLLPPNFSSHSFFSNLASLPSLKVLSLVSLGLWGPLPSTIGTLTSLEILNVSSNHFNNTIPPEISALKNLQTLILDYNLFTGHLPDWLNLLPELRVLSIKNNSLGGVFPNSLSSSENLRIISLSMNHLVGDLPDLRSLTHLQVIDLEDNKLGPNFPNLHNKLVTIVLRKNRFRFNLPVNLASFYLLEKLDVGLNGFVGPFPASVISLPSLTYLDIAENKFTGMLFKNMSCNAQLVYVNMSMNHLTGELPSCLILDSKTRVFQYDGNCLDNTTSSQQQQEQNPYSYCENEALAVKIEPKRHENRQVHEGVLASSLVGGVLGGMAFCGLVFFAATKRGFTKETSKTSRMRLIQERVSPAYTLKLLSDARYISKTMKLGALGLPPYRTFVLDELKEATNNFNKSNFIGEGSHGQVYKGMLIDGTAVAIRSLKMRKRHSIQTYTHQMELISKLRHCHVVSSVGHCFECYPDDSSVRTIFLVSEFVPNGTLRSYVSEGLRGKKFTWAQRIAAAIGIARGIQFLHTGIVPGIFSNNLKITDVLMDQNLNVKISSFNLPLLTENRRQVSDGVPHLESKESVHNRVIQEGNDDVYDLGVILLELIMGRPIVSENEINIAKDLVQVSLSVDEIARRSIIDPALSKECLDESLKTIMEVCMRCLSSEPTHRPSVEDVLWNLQFATQVQEDSCTVDPRSNQGSPEMSTG